MCLFTYLFTEACLEHVKYSDGEFVKIVNGLWLLATFAKPLSGMLAWVLHMFEIYFFYLIYQLFNYYFTIYLFTFLFIDLCVCFKSVLLAASRYYSHVCVSMFKKFVYEDFCKNIF